MRSSILLIGCLFVLIKADGQNLLINPSFEDPVSCPPPNWIWDGLGTIHLAPPWISPLSSADYFTTCYNSVDPFHDVPTNSYGYQDAKDGHAYAGIYATTLSQPPYNPYTYREYLEGTLTEPLQKDSSYRVSFFVSRADRIFQCTAITDRMGAYFHNDFIPPIVVVPPNPYPLVAFIDKKPQVENPAGQMLGDSVNWMPICGYFKASGGERYMTIGNFYDIDDTPIVALYPPYPDGTKLKAYYLVDDISVSLAPNLYGWTKDRTVCSADSLNQYSLPGNFENVQWSTGDTAHTTSIQGAGVFWVRAEIDGCIFKDTFEIKHTPSPLFGFANDTLSVCNSNLPLPMAVGDCCAEVLWSNGDTTSTTEIEQEGLVWVSQQNLCGSKTDSLWLKIAFPQPPNLGLDTALCDTTKFVRMLQAPLGMDAYLWTNGAASSAITIEQPGLYAVEAQNACGLFRDSIIVKDLRHVRLHLSRDTTLCLVSPLTMGANFDFDSYIWSTGQQTPSIEISNYGTYWAMATNACGTQIDSVAVLQSNLPQISIASPIDLYLGDSVLVLPETIHDKPLSFVWYPATGLGCTNCASTYAHPYKSMEYQIEVEDSLHCSSRATLKINVLDIRRVFLPNVFSPNGDGENDELIIALGSGVEKVKSAQVFDRWGGLLSERKDIPFTPEITIWNGIFRGKEALPSVYVVAVEVLFFDGESHWFYGDVTLVR